MPDHPRRHRTALVVVLSIAAVLLVAVLIGGGPSIEHAIALLPGVPAATVGIALLGVSGILLAWVVLRRIGARARARVRSRRLVSSLGGAANTGIRTRPLVAALAELDGGRRPRLASRYSVRVDGEGVSLWSGARTPRRSAGFAWREIRSIRCDRVVVGTASVPLAVFRVRRDGSSVEVPLMLAGDRITRYALPDEAFYTTVRSWKAVHRSVLATEGLELPPLTSPLPIITPEMLAELSGRR
ncbi:hypothetical protein ACDF64_05550 [Agromyces sp. MMS24-JH15]|uniref:hypothetical protein n=1 Tax=Agromyces sp. MMS24-JH15 TaxID=3243765 RepID=UPI003747E74A